MHRLRLLQIILITQLFISKIYNSRSSRSLLQYPELNIIIAGSKILLCACIYASKLLQKEVIHVICNSIYHQCRKY